MRKKVMSVESERERIKSSIQEKSFKKMKKINRESHLCMSNSMHTVGDNQIHTPSSWLLNHAWHLHIVP